jgi:NitT/TauT family transport system permease protein
LSRLRSIFDQVWPRVAAIGGLIAVWWLLSGFDIFAFPGALPPPPEVGSSLVGNWTEALGSTEGIGSALMKSVIRLGFGMLVAIVFGTVIGLAMGSSQFFQRSVGSLITGLQALPSISWLPLAVLWFGVTERAVMFVVIIAAIPAVAIAAANAVRLVPPLLIRAGRTLGARGWRLYRSVVLPAAVPGYVGGLQQAWALAWRALMAGELIVSAGGQGLGHLQLVARNQFQGDLIMAIMVVIIAIGMIVEFGFSALDRRVRGRRGLLVQSA